MVHDAAPAGLRLLDRHFRWRGGSVSRLEGFTDAVFAIVLALLFLRAAPPETFADLVAAMKALVPFAMTFAIVAYVWLEHWLFSRRYDLQDVWTTFLNLLLLFLLLSYAYPLKFLFTLLSVGIFGPIGTLTQQHLQTGFDGPADATRLFVFYGIGYASIFLVLTLLYARALQLSERLALNRVERFLTRSGIVQSLLHSCIGVVSVVAATAGIGLDVGMPGWLYAGIGPLMAVHGAWEAQHLRRLNTAASE